MRLQQQPTLHIHVAEMDLKEVSSLTMVHRHSFAPLKLGRRKEQARSFSTRDDLMQLTKFVCSVMRVISNSLKPIVFEEQEQVRAEIV